MFLKSNKEELRARITPLLDSVHVEQSPADWRSGAVRGDHDLNPATRPDVQRSFKKAAVLVPIVLREAEPHVILTKRADHLNKHAGQISFPGGRAEEEDTSVVHTALRESEEEIGLDPGYVDIIGRLNTYLTVTNYAVTPIVGLVEPVNNLVAEVSEVDEIFEVPLRFLLDMSNHQKHSGYHNGIERFWYAMPYGDYYIWGATAGMIRDLSERVKG